MYGNYPMCEIKALNCAHTFIVDDVIRCKREEGPPSGDIPKNCPYYDEEIEKVRQVKVPKMVNDGITIANSGVGKPFIP